MTICKINGLPAAKVVYQEETTGKYGPGIHNHITDGCGNTYVLTTWRTHMHDLVLGMYVLLKIYLLHLNIANNSNIIICIILRFIYLGETYILCNVVVDHFRPSNSWYQKYPWINQDSFWMSLPYENGKALVAQTSIQVQYVTYKNNIRMPYNRTTPNNV